MTGGFKMLYEPFRTVLPYPPWRRGTITDFTGFYIAIVVKVLPHLFH